MHVPHMSWPQTLEETTAGSLYLYLYLSAQQPRVKAALMRPNLRAVITRLAALAGLPVRPHRLPARPAQHHVAQS